MTEEQIEQANEILKKRNRLEAMKKKFSGDIFEALIEYKNIIPDDLAIAVKKNINKNINDQIAALNKQLEEL